MQSSPPGDSGCAVLPSPGAPWPAWPWSPSAGCQEMGGEGGAGCVRARVVLNQRRSFLLHYRAGETTTVRDTF
eukprot:scaffold15732_cov137-Isochrysis_galbana.AAC.7